MANDDANDVVYGGSGLDGIRGIVEGLEILYREKARKKELEKLKPTKKEER